MYFQFMYSKCIIATKLLSDIFTYLNGVTSLFYDSLQDDDNLVPLLQKISAIPAAALDVYYGTELI